MAETNGTPLPDRITELERENARLRDELAEARSRLDLERQILDAQMLRGVPLTPDGVERALTQGETLGEFLDRVERELGPGA